MFSILKRLQNKSAIQNNLNKVNNLNTSNLKTEAIEYIIVGLGNPGFEYERTRHNIGFMFADFICEYNNVHCSKKKFKSLYCECLVGNTKCLIIKPQTFMNNSGNAVKAVKDYYRISPEKIIIIYDDINLNIGTIRIRQKGSHGGHNGMKNIIDNCKTAEFPRIRIGVGSKPNDKWELSDWVLSKINEADKLQLEKAFINAFGALKLMVCSQIKEAMNKYNGLHK